MPGPDTDYPTQLFDDQAAWTAWLEENHATARGIWLRVAKAASGIRSVTIDEALDGALCNGWIDGQRRTGDADTYLQKFRGRSGIAHDLRRDAAIHRTSTAAEARSV